MAPRPQIIGQSAHAPQGAEAADGVAPTGEASAAPEGEAATAPGTPRATPAVRLDPTRYGDWERNGRCIDF